MPDVVIVDAARTPIGKGSPTKGALRDVHANDLLGAVQRSVIERAAIDPSAVDEVIAGCVQQLGEQSFNVGRNAWLQAGLPIETAATTIDVQCGSGQQAVGFAGALIAAGRNDVMIGCGVEHMSKIPMFVGQAWESEVGTPWPEGLRIHHDVVPQGVAAELIADKWDISRARMDEVALRSHQNAARAIDEGRFTREILTIDTPDGPADTDQGVRRDTSLEALASLSPVFREGGRVTAGNSSQISDGAAAVLLMSDEKAKELGSRPRARIVDHVVVGVDPVLMLTGPIDATRRILARNKMTIDDIDLIEINEAFAPVVVAWELELNPDMERVNVNGGAIALGHPLGSTGARLLTTLLHELERSDKEFGLVTMCCGGGIGTGTLIQRI